MLLQVVLEGAEAQRDAAAVAERAQPQVDAVDESFDRRRRQQLHDLLTEPQEELRVVDRARAVGLAVLRVQKDEIDVGAEIQLAAAELAHRQDHQLLRLPAVHTARHAVAGDQRLIHICAGELDARIGERRKIAQRFVEVGPAGDIAPRDAHHVSLAKAAQRLHRFGFARAAHPLANVAREPVLCCSLEQLAASNQLAQQLRCAQTCSRDELAASPHARQRLVDALLRENFLPRAGIVLARGVQSRLDVGQQPALRIRQICGPWTQFTGTFCDDEAVAPTPRASNLLRCIAVLTTAGATCLAKNLEVSGLCPRLPLVLARRPAARAC